MASPEKMPVVSAVPHLTEGYIHQYLDDTQRLGHHLASRHC
jgi:hypothetical protein